MIDLARPYIRYMSKTQLTTKSITESTIRSLRSEAAGRDTAQVIVCDVALDEFDGLDAYAIDSSELAACRRAAGMTQHDATAECVRVINDARAQVEA